MTRIIEISGHAGSGKDTIGNLMKAYLEEDGKRVLLTHFAGLLKYICVMYFGWNGEKDESGRTLLQHVGTDVVRKKNKNFWVNFLIQLLRFFPDEWDVVIIPDLRFPNELKRMLTAGFDTIHIHVDRPLTHNGLTDEQQEHSSETSMDSETPDYWIMNDGSLDDLSEKVRAIIAQIKEKWNG